MKKRLDEHHDPHEDHGHDEPKGRLQFRHGDLLIEAVDRIPDDAVPQPGKVLAEGEATGHAHVMEDGEVELFRGLSLVAPGSPEEPREVTYLEVKSRTAQLVHEEHRAIPIPMGNYRVIRQREYVPWVAAPEDKDSPLPRFAKELIVEVKD